MAAHGDPDSPLGKKETVSDTAKVVGGQRRMVVIPLIRWSGKIWFVLCGFSNAAIFPEYKMLCN